MRSVYVDMVHPKSHNVLRFEERIKGFNIDSDMSIMIREEIGDHLDFIFKMYKGINTNSKHFLLYMNKKSGKDMIDLLNEMNEFIYEGRNNYPPRLVEVINTLTAFAKCRPDGLFEIY